MSLNLRQTLRRWTHFHRNRRTNSPEYALVAGTLAILKIGAAYVPIDHQYPLERMRHTWSDTAASLTVTKRRKAPGLLREVACSKLQGLSRKEAVVELCENGWRLFGEVNEPACG